MALLPPGVPSLSHGEAQHHADDMVDMACAAMAAGLVTDAQIQRMLDNAPRETLRRVVQKMVGMDESFLMSLIKQVKLVDTVLNQLVTSDGRLKAETAEVGISLKDAMNLSIKVTSMLLKDLPKLYTVDRIQRLERAIGDVMEGHLTKEQQEAVLLRLQELTAE